MQPLNILQVSDAYYPFPGGVSEHMHHLSVALRKRGHKVTILTASYGEDDKKFNGNVVRLGKIIILPARFSVFNLTQLTITFAWDLPFQVKKFIREGKFNIIHTHGALAPNLPHLALHYSNACNIVTFHTAFVGYNWHKLGKLLFRYATRKIDFFIPVSEVAKAAIKKHYHGRYRIIPNGIDIDRFSIDTKPIDDILGLKGRKILYLGRLEPRKGFPFLLNAFPIIKSYIKDALLIVVGDGPERKNYEAMVPSEFKGSVFFKGFVPQERLPSYYRSCELYTSPAIGGETFGIVLLEAMASGIPVVASDIPCYKQVIKDRYNGILINVHNKYSYAKAIVEVLKDETLYKRLREEGHRTAREYSWDRIAEKVEEVYLDALDRKGGKWKDSFI